MVLIINTGFCRQKKSYQSQSLTKTQHSFIICTICKVCEMFQKKLLSQKLFNKYGKLVTTAGKINSWQQFKCILLEDSENVSYILSACIKWKVCHKTSSISNGYNNICFHLFLMLWHADCQQCDYFAM